MNKPLWRSGIKSRILSSLALVGLAISLCAPASAEVVREDYPKIEGAPDTPLYVWRDTELRPKAVALAVHGLVMHGGTYDSMARDLAAAGFVVVAPDMRGYGRWMMSHGEEQCDHATTLSEGLMVKQEPDKLPEIKYDQSYADLLKLTRALRNEYPSLPLYCIGESLGAGMALHLASDVPGSFDGLVLSSPAIKRRSFYFAPRMIVDFMVRLFNPRKEVNLKPYISRWASEDPKIIRSTLDDPLIRKKLRIWDLLRTASVIRPNVKYAKKIPANMPVLIIQGDKDRMVKANGVVTLLSHLRSKDQTIKWFYGKGHLLLETKFPTSETLRVVKSWLTSHSRKAKLVKASASVSRSNEIATH